MKKKIFIVILAVCLIGIIIFGMYVTDRIRMKNNKPVVFSTWGYQYVPPITDDEIIQEGNSKDIVIIKNNKIQNEHLIDEFIEKTDYTKNDSQELNILQDGKKIKITYTPGEYAKEYQKSTDGETINYTTSLGDGSFESRQKVYGYYTLIKEDEEPLKFALIDHNIARTIDGNNVVLYFDAPLIEYVEIPSICSYSVESSDYSKKYSLTYHQRKDLGIKEIYDAGDYKIKTFGGDVSIILTGGDAVYSLEDALNRKVITPEDIFAQVKKDLKYGVCMDGMYSDGGSIEYCYYGEKDNQYTILKLGTLDGENDLVIGMGGPILSSYNKNK
ncbi:MAG: hypothetical protein IKT41_01755 [Clostridia bacterium]|nr:hypothetical protein [Clostridia bacterium]